MKKLLAILFVLCLTLTGCSNNQKGFDVYYSSRNFEKYDAINDVNAKLGTNIVQAGVDVLNETFGIVSDEIAQYTFTFEGNNWCIRASKNVDSDISGLEYDNIGFEKDVTSTYYNDDVYMMRFFKDDIQYVVVIDVKDKEVARSYFDDLSNEVKTEITGVQSGYDNLIYEDGNDVVYKITIYNDDGTKIDMETVYTFDNDKMVSITNRTVFESDEAAKEYYNMLLANGRSADEINLDGSIISNDSSDNLDFYSDYTKAAFIDMMNSALQQ